ncbi:MAG: M20/M25/M40 family metallo-hydrolase [Phycisphaerales bacterium]|nr:M20/M25/M40 family metallo-hydrolase [Phycisphaerales bacterium]
MARTAAQVNELSPGVPVARGAFKVVSKGALKRLAGLFAVIALVLYGCYWLMVSMPGESFAGPRPAATPAQLASAERICADVEFLASKVGKRSTLDPRGMAEAAKWIMAQMRGAGFGEPGQTFVERNAKTPNLEYVLAPAAGSALAKEVVVIGAHYDTFAGTPGADDNTSGVAGVLELARRFAGKGQARQVRFLFFVNEEPPCFQTSDMGSWVYAKACRAKGDDIVAMLSLETIGFYTDEVGYQKYPPLVGGFYPQEGNFIGFVGNIGSRTLTRRCVRVFRGEAQFPCEGAALPGYFPGVGWSDHWAFWQEGYDGVMVTDTAPFRNPHYHLASDKPSTLDYDAMSRVVEGLERVVADLANR